MEDDVRALKVALARVHEQRAATHRLISGIVGPENAERVLRDEAFLPLLKPVLRTDGGDAEAVARLRDAFTPSTVRRG